MLTREEPLSPELVLVDPQLAAIARRELPEPGAWKPAIRFTAAPWAVAPTQSVATVPPRHIPAVWPRDVTQPSADPRFVVGAGSGTPRSRASKSRRLLTLLAAAFVMPFVAASGFSLAVLVRDDSAGSPLPEAGAPSERAGGAVLGGSPTIVPPRRPRARRAPQAQPAHRRPTARRIVRISPNGVDIGSWAVEAEGTVSAAVAAFRGPTHRSRGRFYCRLTWRRLGVRATFYDINGREPCRGGLFVQAVITGRSWRTAEGLRIGSTIASVRRRHRGASRRSGGWWPLVAIERRTFEPWRPDPWLTARVRNGRVVAFYIT